MSDFMPENVNAKRVFVAVNLDDDLKEKIFSELSDKLVKQGKKLVEKENLHLTVKFIGYIDEKNLAGLIEKMKVFESFKKFNVCFEGTGQFHKRILWLGIKQGLNELNELTDKMNELLGLQKERSAGHLTIARVKEWKDRNELNEFLGKKFEACFQVKSVDLMQSKLSFEGPTYSVVKKFSFA